jgi:hypothetical protein
VQQPVLILDYASPRTRTRLRMPSKSVLDVIEEPGGILVVETLSGRAEAVGAIAFGVFMLIYLTILMIALRGQGAGWVLGPFWLAEAVVLILVIHQTWRKTTLIVTDRAVWLRFISPLTRKAYQWPAQMVASVSAVPTAHATAGQALAELAIHLNSGQQICLFTDHPDREIDRLSTTILDVLRPKADK